MIHEEDIIKIRRSQKDDTHRNTPIDRYNDPMYRKNDTHRNTHHTRQGGRTDHSTSSHGPDPSSTDRVMKILRDMCIVVWGYSGIGLDILKERIKDIRNLWR